MTYYRNNDESKSPSPFVKKTAGSKKKKYLYGTVDIIIAIVLVGLLMYSLVLKPEPQVRTENYMYHSKLQYESEISKFFGGINNSNKLSFNGQRINQEIRKRFPEVKNSSIELPFFDQKPIVWLNISEPAFKLVTVKHEYIVDMQGKIVGNAMDYPNIKGLQSVIDQSGYETSEGNQILSWQSVGFINQVTTQLKAAHVPVDTLILPPKAQELDLKTTDKAYIVKFYLGGDALIQTGQLMAARHNFDKKGGGPGEYLDVRVPGKIFYK
jgi:hypothetical protein